MALPNTEYAFLYEREIDAFCSNIIHPSSVLIRSGFINRKNTEIYSDGNPTNTVNTIRPFDMATYTKPYNDNRFGTTGETSLLESDVVPYTLSRAYASMARIGLGTPQNTGLPKLYAMLHDHTHYLTPSGSELSREIYATRFAQSATGTLINSIDKHMFQRLFENNSLKEDLDNATDVHGLSKTFASEVQPDYTWTSPIYRDLDNAVTATSNVLSEIDSLINVISSDNIGLDKQNFNMQAYMLVPDFVFNGLKRLEFLAGNCNRYANDSRSSKVNYQAATDFMAFSDNVIVVNLKKEYFPLEGDSYRGLILFPDALKMAFQGLPTPTDLAVYSNSPVARAIGEKMMRKIGAQYLDPTDIKSPMQGAYNTAMPASAYDSWNWGEMVYTMLSLNENNFGDNRFVFTQNIFNFYGDELRLRPDSLSQGTVAKVECMFGTVRNRPKQIQPILFNPALFELAPPPSKDGFKNIPSQKIKYIADSKKN